MGGIKVFDLKSVTIQIGKTEKKIFYKIFVVSIR